MRYGLLILCGAFVVGACSGFEDAAGFEPRVGAPSRGPRPGGGDVIPGEVDAGALPHAPDAGGETPDTGSMPPVDATMADVVEAPMMPVMPPPPPPKDAGVDHTASVPEVAPPVVPPPPLCPAAKPGEIDLWVPGPGNCSYPLKDLPEYVAAVDKELYAAGAACGSCLEVSGDRGSVVAMVVDQYPVPPSARGHKISLSNAALVKVAGPGVGLAHLNWRWAPCPATGSATGALKDGSSAFYWEVILNNVTNRVVKFEYATAIDATFKEAFRTSYNYFRLTPAMGLPKRLRLTDTAGNVQTTEELPWPANGGTAPIPLGVQFPPACRL